MSGRDSWAVDGRLPVAVTVLIITAVWVMYLPLMPVGGISDYDEFLTLDRSLSFARTGDWFTVFSSNAPSFQKPPLQYWMTAGLLAAGVDETVALRLPSMLFALGMLGVTAWLARLLAPNLPWAMPLAVLLLSSSVWFWSYANSAMLDAGAAVFAAGALAAAIVALHRPRVWYVVAAVVGVGALQKAPVGLMFLASALPALWLARRAVGPEWAPPAQSPSFLRAAVIAIALVLAWPLLQSALHGIKAAKASHGREMVARFVPDAQEGLRSFAEVAELLVTGEPWLRWPALAAVLVLPFLVRRPGAWMVAGVVVVYAAALKMAGGTVYPRYTLTILPLLMAALAVVLLHLRPSPLAGMIAGGALIVMSGGPLQVSAVRGEALQPATISLQIGVLKDLSPEVAPEETLVYCLSRGVRRLLPGAVSVYASNGREFVAARDLRAKSGAVEGPFRGVCPATEIGQVEPIMRGFAVVRSEFGYVVWTADGLR